MRYPQEGGFSIEADQAELARGTGHGFVEVNYVAHVRLINVRMQKPCLRYSPYSGEAFLNFNFEL